MSYNPKSFRKYLAATMSSAAIVTTIVAPIAPMTVEASIKFSDVSSNVYYSNAVKHLVEKGIIKGYSDGTFRPNQQITRAEAAKMIVEMLGVSISNSDHSPFSDVEEGMWYTLYINTLAKMGIVNGYPDGTFNPNGTITRAEMAKMLVQAFDDLEKGINSSFTDVSPSEWYAPYIGSLVEKEITTGVTNRTFAPNEQVTRAQVATFLYRIDLLNEREVQIIEEITEENVTINGITYTLSSTVKGILNPMNSEILKNSEIRFESNDQQITNINDLAINQNGSSSKNVVLDGNGSMIKGNLTVNADFVSIKNTKITGDLVISGKIQNLFNSTGLVVEGKVVVNDSLVSAKSMSILNVKSPVIIFENASLNKMDIRKANVQVETKGSTSTKEITVTANNTTINGAKGYRINKITILDNVKSFIFNAEVETLSIESNGEFTISGNAFINTLLKEGTNQVIINKTVKIGNVIVDKGKNVKDIIENYEEVKQNIEKINGNSNPDFIPVPSQAPSTGGGGSGSVNPIQRSTLSVTNDVATLGLVGTSTSTDTVSVATATLNPGTGKVDITSVGAGSATITVTDGANSATITVTVAADGTITVGTITKYNPFTAKMDSSVTNDVATLGLVGTSTSTDTVSVATATLNPVTGKVDITSVGAGSATIIVTDGINSATIAVTVAADGTITVGTITKYDPFIATTDSSVTNDVATLGLVGTSTSTDTASVATATLNAGTGKVDITSVGAGSATITVTDGANNATIGVTVAADGTITVGTITKYDPFIARTDSSVTNDVATLGLVGTTASTSDANVATAAINAGTGKVDITSVGAGSATITVSDGTFSGVEATIAVTVAVDGTITVGTITKVDIQPPSILEVKKIKNVSSGKYDKIQIKFSENILDQTVAINNFEIYVDGTIDPIKPATFSTNRSDGILDNDVNDEYITLSFSERGTVDSVSYIKGTITDLSGNSLLPQNITPID